MLQGCYRGTSGGVAEVLLRVTGLLNVTGVAQGF